MVMKFNSKLVKQKDFFQIVCEKKSIKEIKNEDGEVTGVEIEGYASTKDKDRVNDIVEPKAFKDALDGYMLNPVVLLQHKADKPVGTVTEASIKPKGLYIKATITEDQDGILSALKNGVIRAFSIGYRVKDYSIDEVKNDAGEVAGHEMVIKDLELYEISLVSIPANPYALMKSLDSCVEVEAKELNADGSIDRDAEVDKKIEEAEKVEEIEEIEEETKETEEIAEEVEEIEETPTPEAISEGWDDIEEGWEEETPLEEKEEQGELETTEIVEEKEDKDAKLANGIEEMEEEVEEKGLSRWNTIEMKLTEKLKEEKNIEDGSSENLYVCGIFNTEFVYNHYQFGDNGFDTYYRRGYTNSDGDVSLSWEDVEVEAQTEWVDATKGFKDAIEAKATEEVTPEAETTEAKDIDVPTVEETAPEAPEAPIKVEDALEAPEEETKEVEESKIEDEKGEQDSENVEETATDDIETDVVEEAKSLKDLSTQKVQSYIDVELKANKESLLTEVKDLLESKNETVDALTKKLDWAMDVIKWLTDYIEKLDKQLSKTIIGNGIPYETPAKKTKKLSAYGSVVNGIQKAI